MAICGLGPTGIVVPVVQNSTEEHQWGMENVEFCTWAAVIFAFNGSHVVQSQPSAELLLMPFVAQNSTAILDANGASATPVSV